MSSSVLGCCSIFAVLVVSVYADCTLRIESNGPLLVKHFGSRIVLLDKNIQNLKLAKSETIEAYCDSNMILGTTNRYHLSGTEEIRRLKLECDERSGDLFYNYSDKRGTINQNTAEISCSEREKAHLFESQGALPFCENYTSFGVGIPPETQLAGICYDLDTMSLKYVSYLEGTQTREEFLRNQNPELHSEKLGKKIGNWEVYFPSQKLMEAFQWQRNTTRFLNLFDYESIIQDAFVLQELDDLRDVMNVLWYRNLRLGNWKFYLEALRNRTSDVKYYVHTGVSGEVTVPQNKCNDNNILSITADEIRVTAPKYIWSYIKSVNSHSIEEFVVIGQNTPFGDMFDPSKNSESIAFCEDMCDQIQWLKNSIFGKLRQLAAMGRVFCCRPEEVQKFIPNFPYKTENVDVVTYQPTDD